MKKKVLLIFITFITVIIFGPPLARATDSSVSAKAQDLLDRVATKVAQLSEKLQKCYWGKIKTLGARSLVITTENGEKAISTSDVTSFFRVRAGSRTEINFTALKIGDDIAAIGTIDPATTDLTARQIIAKIRRQTVVGKITSIDKDVYTVDSNTKLDFSDAVLKLASTSGKITPAKIADFKEGSTVFAIAVSPDEKTGVFSVLKALVVQTNAAR